MIKTITLITFLLVLYGFSVGQDRSATPNIIIIFADDMAYGDIGVYNPQITHTPNLNTLAKKGLTLTNFYASQPVCSASRASLLTGTYANRIGIHQALMPNSKVGIHPEETTVAEMLRSKGYATSIFGKWHLGDAPKFNPVHHGFDEFYGIPYSNDMWPVHPDENLRKRFPPLPLYHNQNVIDTITEQSWFTSELTKRAVSFILENKQRPFFVYLAHPMPHVPLYVSARFKGKSGKGLYADVIMEIDWSVGEIMKALRDNGLEENTFLIFTSDNGPWLSYGNHSGSTAGLREGKGTAWEGGVKEPCIMFWKGKIPPGKTLKIPAMTIDILPTLAHITGAALPERKIDGTNIWAFLTNPENSDEPDRALFFYYEVNELQAMRWKQWKLYFPHTYRTMAGQLSGKDGKPGPYKYVKILQYELFNLESDPFEEKNVAEQFPDLVRKMAGLADEMRRETGDKLTNITGTGYREPGRIE